MESEYVALSLAVDEVLIVSTMLSDIFNISLPSAARLSSMEVIQVVNFAVPLFTDNMSAITVGNNDASHGRSRHINYRFHNVKQAVKDGLVSLLYKPSNLNESDFLTKALTRHTFNFMRKFYLKRMEEC
jgi:hypothetical protein